MSIDRLNAKNGFSVGIPAIPVIDSSGAVTVPQVLATGAITGTQLGSTIANGTAPLVVASSTLVTNLNADAVDGRHVNDAGVSSSDLWTASKIIAYSIAGSGGVVTSITAGNGLVNNGTATTPDIDINPSGGIPGLIGTLSVSADQIGVMLGTTSTVAARGDDSRFDRTLVFNGDATGTGASSSTITLTVVDDSHNHTVANGNFTVLGNLVVSGATITLATQNAVLYDPILTLGGSGIPAFDDAKDRGIEFKWHNGTAGKTGFFGYDDSTGYFTFIPDATNTGEVFSGTMGDIQAGNFRGNLIGTATLANFAVSADRANYATQATSARNADLSDLADIALYATFAGSANRANYSTQASSARNADIAYYSSIAGSAATAGTAANASNAQFASQATSANFANDIAGGAANQIPFQTAAHTTSFVGVTGTGNVVLATTPSIATPNLTSPAIDTHTVITSYTLTTATVTVDQLIANIGTTYRTAEFIIQGTDATNSKFHVTKILAVQNGTTAIHTEYGTLISGSSAGAFNVDYSAGIRLLVTPTSTSSTVFKVTAILTKA